MIWKDGSGVKEEVVTELESGKKKTERGCGVRR